MRILTLFVPFLFFSCFEAKKTKQNSHYDKMWESRANLKKERSFRVIKDKGRVVGYIDEEYVNKIFLSKNNSLQLNPEIKNQPTAHELQNDVKTVDTNAKKDEVNTKIPDQIVVAKSKNESSPSKSPDVNKIVSQPTKSNQQKGAVEKKIGMDFSRLNFYFSDLKSSSTKTKKLGSFKINLMGANMTNLTDSFFEKLICKVEVIEGEKIHLTNWKGDLDVNNQNLISIKRTFHNDMNVSLRFSLEKFVKAKIKISFYVKDDPEKIFVVKNGKEEILNL